MDPFSVVGAGLNYFGAHQANKATQKMAREQMDFQERMSNTAYQRSVHDMQQAGLNPMLALNAGGASTPSGATAQMTNEMSGAVASAQAAKRMSAEIENMHAQNENLKTQNSQIKSQTQLNEALREVAQQEAALKSASAKAAIYKLPALKTESEIEESWYGKGLRWLDKTPAMQLLNLMSSYIKK